MKNSGDVKVTKSKSKGVVAIQISGNPNKFKYPGKSTPNKVILVQNANGYPIGKLHYDKNGNLTRLEPLVESVNGFWCESRKLTPKY